ncbi:hypothetical protein HQQ94_01945 [Shewanella sp. VB17]|uniref:hypothetical protein n=1 Tax=Shewanella sp. VB17 TaxID=2739432 RepID=UPI0015644625|nr:hypothetical protein [Shewanella sp. VB17]NRD72024.1 hypothetical protein [Shewanella sp. VB17]
MSKLKIFARAERRKKVKVEPQNNRQHIRVSLRKKTDDSLVLACDGITVTIYSNGWWRSKKLGIANIKDIGIGGIGLLTSVHLKLDQKIRVQLQEQLISVKISRAWPINNKLNFYGACWLNVDEHEVIAMLNKTRHVRF